MNEHELANTFNPLNQWFAGKSEHTYHIRFSGNFKNHGLAQIFQFFLILFSILWNRDLGNREISMSNSWSKTAFKCTSVNRDSWVSIMFRSECEAWSYLLRPYFFRDMRVGGILPITEETWIGFSDLENEGVWTWTDNGKFPDTISWASTEPNGGRAENCALLSLSSEKFVFIDHVCSSAQRYVCEREFRHVLSFTE